MYGCSVKLTAPILSILFLLLIVGFIILEYKFYDISSIFFNLHQLFSGSFADKFVVAVHAILISTTVSRLGAFPCSHHLQRFTRRYILSHKRLTDAASLLALSSFDRNPERQRLVLLMSIGSLALRCSGFQNDTKSLKSRLRSRLLEYLLYIWLPRCSLLLDPRLLLPFLILVSASRSMEVFRSWRTDRISDHDQASEMFNRVDNMLKQKLMKDLDPDQRLSWPNTGPKFHYGDARRDKLREILGIFRYMKHVNIQYTFLWVKGTGMVVFISYYTILTLLIRHPVGYMTLFCSVTALVFLTLQCIPGFLARVDVSMELLTNEDDVKTMAYGILQPEWFIELHEFIKDLMDNGTPFSHTPVENERVFTRLVRILEGHELICYVLLYGLSRMVINLSTVCIAVPLKVAMKGRSKLIRNAWLENLAPPLAYGAARLCAPDIYKPIRTIVQAEVALDTRKLCNICILETVEVQDYLQKLKESIGYNSETHAEGALQMALHDLAMSATEEVQEDNEIVQRLRKLLLLVKIYHESAFDKSSSDIQVLKRKLEAELKEFSSVCKGNYFTSSARAKCGCVSELDWRILAAQFCVSMLLQAYEPPKEERERLSYGPTILMLWMEERKKLNVQVDLVSNVIEV